MSKLNVGVDVGTSTIAVTLLNTNGEVVKDVTNTTISVGKTAQGGLRAKTLTGNSNGHQGHTVVGYENTSYNIGGKAWSIGDTATRTDFSRFSDSLMYKVLLKAAILKALLKAGHNPTTVEVDVVLAMPLEMIKSEEALEQTEKDMAEWLVGEHVLQVEEAMHRLKVTGLMVIEQPTAAWFSHFFDFNLTNIDRAGVDRDGRFVTLHVGGGTADVAILRDGAVDFDRTKGDQLGMYQAAARLRNRLQEMGTTMPLLEANEKVEQWVTGVEWVSKSEWRENTEVTAYVAGKQEPINHLIKESYLLTVEQMIDFFGGVLGGNTSNSAMLAVGRPFLGGAKSLLYKQLQAIYPQLLVTDDPAHAVADGAYKAAIYFAQQD